MSATEFVNGGAILVLIGFVGAVIKWLVDRLHACEARGRGDKGERDGTRDVE